MVIVSEQVKEKKKRKERIEVRSVQCTDLNGCGVAIGERSRPGSR